MSKQNRDKNLSLKIKKFLKGDKKSLRNEWEIQLSEEEKEELGPNSPIEIRIKAIKDLKDAVTTRKMNEVEIRKLWLQVRDLAQMNKLPEHRHLVLKLLSTVCESSDNIGLSRQYFFNHIVNAYRSEDAAVLLNFLCVITNNGKTVKDIELEIGSFLALWLPTLLQKLPSAIPAITFTTNLFKFNAAFITDEENYSLVKTLLCYCVMNKEEMDAFLNFMQSLVAYCYIPNGLLIPYVSTLARHISVPRLVEPTWRVMRNLLTTSMGVEVIFAICEIIEKNLDFHRVRGSIYFLSNALWTSNRIDSLSLNPIIVLPTLHAASENSHPLVIYETAISIHKLVSNKKACEELYLVTWKVVLDILSRLFLFTDNFANKEQGQMIFNVLNSTLDVIQELIDLPFMWQVCPEYFDIIDTYSEQRKVASVLKYVEYMFKIICPNEENWVTDLNALLQKYFKLELRPQIRLYCLEELTTFFTKFRYPYGETICNEVILCQLDKLEDDPNMELRKVGISLLVEAILTLNIPASEQMLCSIEKVVLSVYNREEGQSFQEFEVKDITEGVNGLIKVFKRKIWTLPSSYAIQAYQILMAFLGMHYKKPYPLASVPSIRTEIFKMIFEMRADSSYHLGLPNCPEAIYPFKLNEAPPYIRKYSQYIVVDHKFGIKPQGASVIRRLSIGPPENFSESPPKDDSEGEKFSVETLAYLKMDEDLKVDEEREARDTYHKKDLFSLPSEETPTLQSLDDVSPPEEEILLETSDCLKTGILDDPIISLQPSKEVAHLSLINAARLVILAMKEERDWPLLKLILDKIPEVLQNKALILSKEGNDVGYLANVLHLLVTDQTLSTSHFSNLPQGFRRTEFNCCIYPVIANLAAYHQDLNMTYKTKVIQCLQSGMQSDASALCIRALTLCALEMRKAMGKLATNIMFSLAKMSATVINAQPSLEFLSTLLHLRRVYSDFLQEQYMAVFAIAIPYTNPFKFNHYIVLLAYHVISMWFLKCRLSYRRKFVNYISKNLLKTLEQDNPQKFKTSSYSEQHPFDRRYSLPSRSMSFSHPSTALRQASNISKYLSILGKSEADMIQFHKDLRETCIDFMSRNCFDTFSPVSRRKPVADFLLNSCQMQMWLVGTRIITITTSGCSQRPIINGICEKCMQLCSSSIDKNRVENILSQEDLTNRRRRHKSELHPQVSNEAKYEPQTKDDLHTEQKLKRSSNVNYQEDLISHPFDKDKLDKDCTNLSTGSSSSLLKDGKEPYVCSCWCKGWAEVHIRQPTGDVSYMVRLQNFRSVFDESDDLPMDTLCSLLSPLTTSEQQSLHADDYGQNSRYRPQSGDSERTLASETDGALGYVAATDWNNSGSVPSSGTTSLTSSDLRLNHLPDCDAYDKEKTPQHRTVCHCYSNPETNLRGANSTDSGSFQLAFSSASDSHSTTPYLDKANDPQFATRIKTRTASGTVRRSNSMVGSPSPPPSSIQSNRSRHVSAFQPSTCFTSAVTPDDDGSIDPNLQPMNRGRVHTISDMTDASRRTNLKKLFSRRPTLGNTGSLFSTDGDIGAGSTNTASSSISLQNEGAIYLGHSSGPIQPTTSSSSNSSISSLDNKETAGVSPSSFFMQLFYHGPIGGGYMRPIPLPNTKEIKRAISLLDYIKPQENHRIGVLYVGPYQNTEAEILRNESGSLRYLDFLDGLGTVYNFCDLPKDTFLGGLDSRVDGDYVYLWHDDIMQIVFHVATAMPNRDNDPNANHKKRHIGNNYVTIVYNERDCPYGIDTIKSQFNHAVVEIVPGDHNTNLVRLSCRPDLVDFINWTPNEHPRLVSDNNLPVIVRQIALHVNLASMIWEAQKRSEPYSPYWLHRLRKIRSIREKILGPSESEKQYKDHQQQIFTEDLDIKSDSPYLDFIDLINFDKTDSNHHQRSSEMSFRR